MGVWVEHLPHSCGSSDGLAVYENGGKFDGYCHVCDTYEADPYSTMPSDYKPNRVKVDPARTEARMDEIRGLPVLDLPSRKLKRTTFEYFGVKTGFSEQHRDVVNFVHFPYYSPEGEIVAYKSRLLEPKNQWSVGPIREGGFFGWKQAKATGAKRLFICEGEFDALALYQALMDKQAGTKWENYHPAVVSIPNGAASAKKFIMQRLSDIRAFFSEIVLVFDMDDAGQNAATEVSKVIPDVTVAKLPYKDANECLIQGKPNGLCSAVMFQSKKLDNQKLINASSLFEKAKEPAQLGLSWPWKAMNDMTRGIRFGETYYLGAGVKMGKSEMVNTIASHCMIEHDLKVFLAKPEEANAKTVKLVAGKVVGKVFHDPLVPFDGKAYDEATDMIGDKLMLLNLYQHLGWESLKDNIRSAVEEGAKVVIIDPITNLINGIDSGVANTMLQGIAQELAAMALDLDIVIFIFCHLKAPDAGKPHERGGKVQSYQFAGSRAMMRSCNYMIGIEGNKDPDIEEEQRNVRRIVMLEDREFGSSGYFHLYWDKNTQWFNEVHNNE